MHAVARQSASAASADFASGAAEDFRSADMVADGSTPIAPLSPLAAGAAAQRKGLSGLAARIVFGTALGVAGALVILTGGWCYMISACFVAYQASREYFGFLTSKVRTRAGACHVVQHSSCFRKSTVTLLLLLLAVLGTRSRDHVAGHLPGHAAAAAFSHNAHYPVLHWPGGLDVHLPGQVYGSAGHRCAAGAVPAAAGHREAALCAADVVSLWAVLLRWVYI